jgi:hypothetical protein
MTSHRGAAHHLAGPADRDAVVLRRDHEVQGADDLDLDLGNGSAVRPPVGEHPAGVARQTVFDAIKPAEPAGPPADQRPEVVSYP